MDLLAAHRHGLVDSLETEAAGLAGRPGDTAVRAIAMHHLFDHSAGLHVHALLCADGALGLDAALAGLAQRARRARWRIGAARSAALVARVAAFGEALKAIDRARCEAMLIAYRLSRRPALRDVAVARFGDELVAALTGHDRRALFLACQRWQEDHWGVALEAAIVALAWPLKGAPVAALIEGIRPTLTRFEAGEKRGWAKVEQAFAAHRALPKGYAANPGDAYYRLQRQVAERRRRALAELDLVADEAVTLAA